MLPIELTNEEIMNFNAYKEYYAIATGAAPPKPKASVQKTRSSSDTSVTPPTVAVGSHDRGITTEAKTKRSLQQTHISHASGSGVNEGTGSIPGVPDVPTDESVEELSWNSTDDEGDDDEGNDGDDNEEDEGDDGEEGDDDDADPEVERDKEKDDKEEGGDDEHEYDKEESDEETRDEGSFDPNPKTPKSSDDEGNGEEDLGLNAGREEGHIKEEEEDELYRDVNINQGRGIQVTQEVEDSHVTLTPVNPDEKMMNFSRLLMKTLRGLSNRRSKNRFRTSYAIVADILEMELKKILIEKMKGNKSIQRSDKQSNLYRALDEEPSAGPDQGSKRLREGKELESTKTPIECATRSAGRSTHGSRSGQASASEFAIAEEPMQTTFQMDEPTHLEFDTGVFYWRRKRQQFYGFTVNLESARDVYSMRRIIVVTELKIVEWHNYKHLDWITVRRDDDKLYKFKEGDFKRLRIQDIEDIDGTLTDVRTALDDRLKGIRMQYLPTSIWRKSDKDRAAAMIQAIDKILKTRRIMRSLERFVGGRLYEGDLRMLQRTI
nr:hypothetical protein [Tanacetum cinerariifolium]